MEELMNSVHILSREEYIRAAHKFKATNSGDHESYAIIFEEFQEMEEEAARVQSSLNEFWALVKTNGGDIAKVRNLKDLERDAIALAAEAIQVAAMAFKAQATIERRTPHAIEYAG